MNDVAASPASIRWCAYWLLIALAVGNMSGRILSVSSIDRTQQQRERIKKAEADFQTASERLQTRLDDGSLTQERFDEEMAKQQERLDKQLEPIMRPFLSGNDRSRWNTIRALVDHGVYHIDDTMGDLNWDTIDMVKHYGRDNQPHYYSSKPTLLPTLLAGQYWLVQQATGWTLKDQPFEAVRTMLILTNVLPMILMFFLIAKLAEEWGTTDWGRLFIVAAACFATFLSTFATALNNHTAAAVSATIAGYAAVRIWNDERKRWWWFVLAGAFGLFTVSNELPALAFFCLLGAGLLWKAPKPTLLFFVPAAVLVAGAHFGTNWVAHGTWRPPYSFRAEGEDWTQGNWYNYTITRGNREIDSYWRNIETRAPIDRGEPSIGKYALHVLVGHHGIFSLTPIWALTVLGLLMALARADDVGRREWALLVSILSVVIVLFYIFRPEEDRNYGGTASGLRWVFWLTPLWLTAMLPAVDWFGRRGWGRALTALLLAFSALSVSYPTWNPWVLPWISRYMQYHGLAEF